MKKLAIAVILLLTAALAFSQQMYTERVLQALGLDEDEIQEVMDISSQSESELRRHQADLDIKKAELARLLLDDEPNMRLVERNLNETAAIEVQIRLAEIQRELAIRDVLGAERWARIIEGIRARRVAEAQRQDQTRTPAASPQAEQLQAELAQKLSEIQRGIVERQQALSELLRGRRELFEDPEIRRVFEELEQQFQELQELMRAQR